MESVIATREEVNRFLSIRNSDSDYGDGRGTACGSSCGDGTGTAFGLGTGIASGFGYGAGEGSGYIACYGYSNGYGEGNFTGHGYGYCSGSGVEDEFGYGVGNENIKSINDNIVDYVDSIPTIITQVHGNIARGYIVNLFLELIPCFIAKAGNSFAHGETIKEALSDASEKEMKRLPLEERIKMFKEVFGDLDSEHTGIEFYNWHHTLTSSCRVGRDEFCKDNNIDLEKKYTVRYFLDITKESYGSDIIKLLRKSYKI